MLTNAELEYLKRVPNELNSISNKQIDARTFAAISFAQGFAQCTKYENPKEYVAKIAVDYADALLAELKKKK